MGYEICYRKRYYVFATLEEATRMAGDIVMKTGIIVNIGLSKRRVNRRYKVEPITDEIPKKYKFIKKVA